MDVGTEKQPAKKNGCCLCLLKQDKSVGSEVAVEASSRHNLTSSICIAALFHFEIGGSLPPSPRVLEWTG